MGKQTEDKLKVIFKTSLATLCTRSKTCSGISQLSTRSGVLRIQKSLRKKHSYYVDKKGKVKRDLSIETDFCYLRRFCRQKLNMTSNLGSSAKSRYSAMDTEVGTIEEFPDASACGDNEITEIRSNYPTNLECLMVDNLKNLLGQWIEKHLISKNESKQKLDTVFDCILNKLKENSEQEISSDTTYVIHKEEQNQEVKNKKIATAFSCQFCKHKSSRKLVTSKSSHNDFSSAPVPGHKDMRIISTLSIPRTFNKRGLDGRKKRTSSCKLGKIKRRNIILSIDKFDKLIDTTSFDLLAVSAKSLAKRYQHLKEKKHIIFFRKPFYRSATCTANILNSKNVKVNDFDSKKYLLEALPSLLNNLYKNESVIVNSSADKNVQFDTKNDNSTMTDGVTNEIINTDVIEDTSAGNQIKYDTAPTCSYKDINYLTINKTTYTSTSHMNFINKKSKKRGKVNKRRRQIFGNKISPNTSKLSNLDSKHFTFMYETATKQILQGQDLLKYWQSLFQYFNENNGNKKIKLDIHISLSPQSECETKDTCTDICNDVRSLYEDVNGDATILYNMKPETEPSHLPPIAMNSQLETESDIIYSPRYPVPEIIPLLDGAVSQAKYILDASSREKVENKSNWCVDHSMMTNEIEILQEISDLKLIIKNLAMNTEKLVTKQIRKDSGNSNIYASLNPSYNYTSSSKCEAVINLINLSKAIQVGAEFKTNLIKSENKVSKTKDTLEYYNRLTKKSTSFRIIDSESLLRVTDMTSKGDEMNKFNHQFIDEALMCAIPKSLSLFDLPSERNKKLIAFFCDNCVKPKVDYRNSGRSSGRPVIPRPKSCKSGSKNKKWHFWRKPKKTDIRCPRSTSGSSCVIPISNLGYTSTSSCRTPNSMIDDEELGKPCKVTRGMGFSEGCMYCMLLWIPVLILGCLFYSHILKDYVVSPDKILYGKRTSKVESIPNSTVVYLKLSDLGF